MILYVSKLFGDGDFGADQHYRAICDIYGEDNVFTVDLSPHEPYRRDRYIAYGKCRSPIHRIGRWIQGNMQYISAEIISEIIELIGKEQIKDVFIEDSVFGNLVYRIKQVFPEIRVICFYHDIKYVLYAQWIKKLPLHNKIELQIGRRQEQLSQKYSDVELVLNGREAVLYEKTYGRKPDGIIPLSAPDPDFQKMPENQAVDEKKILDVVADLKTGPEMNRNKIILFVGKNYYPNIDGIRWFVKNVMPGMPTKARLWIVGRGVEFLKSEFNAPGINVIGSVESLSEYYHKADVVITPLFEGGGMKLKTLEAISYGKRIAGTRESFVGVWNSVPETMRQKLLFCSEDAEEWVRWITNVLDDDQPRFSEEVYDLFQAEFSYSVMKKKMQAMLLKGMKSRK